MKIQDNNQDFYEPQLNAAVNATTLEFAHAASKMLEEFRTNWVKDHEGDGFAASLELDLVPILWDGNMHGFLVISEIDGESYDFAPAHLVRKAT